MAMIAAEELGIPYEQVRANIADTTSLGHNDMTEGSRGTFSSGMATIFAARDAIGVLKERAAKMWGVPVDDVVWEKGQAVATGKGHGNLPPLSLKEIAAKSGRTGGPIAGHNEVVADGAGMGFASHICDVEVDPETGRSTIVRYTVVQDAGKAINPDYVEGQFQGGATQGIGWALNEEYIYGDDGRLQNPGFLDYRIPVCSDLPFIDTKILEVPNPLHPYGIRGVGETSIVPPLAAVGNAIANATGVRMTHAPMSPPECWQLSMKGHMRVSLSSTLQLADGPGRTVEVQAETIAEVMASLTDRYPSFQQLLDRGVAVSIDGQIFRDDWTQRIPLGAEVFLIPRIEGG